MDAGPRRLGSRYRLLRRVGAGNMSHVWIARDERLDRDVAVKLVTSEDVGERDRVLREARTIAAISDPHVVTVHDAVEEANDAAIVMELVHGGTLDDVIREQDGPMEVDRALGYALEISVGLAAAHDAGLVHRDVKPSNVLVRRDGSLAVADFGIAGSANRTTNTTTIRGSLPYVAPEQIHGRTPDPRTDVYALGCLLMVLLTGRPPFDGDPGALIRAHLHDPAPRLRDLRPDVPEALDELVARMLAKRPEDRPADMHTVHSFLLAARARKAHPAGAAVVDRSGPTTVVPGAATSRPSPRAAMAPVLAAVAGLLVGLLVLGAWAGLGDGTEETPTQAEEVAAPLDPEIVQAAVTPEEAAEENPETVDEAVAAFRRHLDELRSSGDATDKAVEELGDKVTEIQEKAVDDPQDAWKKARELEEKVVEQQEKGELTANGVEVLRADAAALVDLTDAERRAARGNDRGEDDDEDSDDD